jgi:hypothetical protein
VTKPTPRDLIKRWLGATPSVDGFAERVVRVALAIIDAEHKPAVHQACSCGAAFSLPCFRKGDHEAALWRAIQGE